jgi:O-antigen/teichoic acid export membrane protein
VLFGIVAGVICALGSLLVTGQARLALLALAPALPGLVLQETWRQTFFAEGRPRAAAINDLIWTVIQFGLLGVVFARGDDSVVIFTLIWGFSASVAALVGIVQAGVRPKISNAVAWFRETRDLNVRMALDFALNMGAFNLAITVVGVIVGLAGLGSLRAAQQVLGPLNLLFAGLSAFFLPVLARQAGAGRRLFHLSLAASAACGAVAGTWVLILVLIPDSVGEAILGDSWAGARSVMIGSGLIAVAVAFVLGPSLGLKALGRADQMLRVTFLQAPIMLAFGTFGAWQWGAVGAAYGFAIAQIFGLVVCWTIFLRSDTSPRHRL